MAAGRYAPSPTGELHVGNLRTAMVAWLLARAEGRRFLLRVEDLDDTATRRQADGQLADLEALGIDWDGPVVYQSELVAEHRRLMDHLVAGGDAYPCWCSRREIREAASAPHGDPQPDGAYPGTCRRLTQRERRRRETAAAQPPALRLRATVDRLGFDDRHCGPTTASVDDFVIRRRDGVPAYHLAVVADDHAMGVDQVVRGDDLLLSTPRHLHLADRLGFARPHHVHVPLVLNPTGDRLAKRDGAVTLADLAERGWSVERVRGVLAASLGLCADDDRPTMSELLASFSLDALPHHPTIFDPPAATLPA